MKTFTFILVMVLGSMSLHAQTFTVVEEFFPGTYYQGSLDISYDRLVQTFGEPTPVNNCRKVDVEWNILFEDGTPANIYNYDSGYDAIGSEGLPVQQIEDWHVGGYGQNGYYLVKDILTIY